MQHLLPVYSSWFLQLMNPFARYKISPVEMLAGLVRNRYLILQLTRREVLARYRESMLGLIWALLNPLVMLAVYTFVFSVVFKARWHVGSAPGGRWQFALALFIGLIIHTVLAECVNRAPSLILGHANYVKKVVFPLEILPWIQLGASLFHALASLLIWLIFFVFVNHTLHWTIVFLPLIILPLLSFAMGLSWLLAAVGVYLRDISQLTVVFTTILLFMSPVFYPLSNLPVVYQRILYLNPLTPIIVQAREVLMWGRVPDWPELIVVTASSLLVAWVGFVVFQKSRRGFADIM